MLRESLGKSFVDKLMDDKSYKENVIIFLIILMHFCLDNITSINSQANLHSTVGVLHTGMYRLSNGQKRNG